MISTRAKALKYSNRSGPFLRRDLAPYYSAIDTSTDFALTVPDLGPPDKLARSVAIDDQSLKLRTVGGAKVQANVITSHAPYMAHQVRNGNPMSGGEH